MLAAHAHSTHGPAHWLWVHLGISGTGPWYGFWSGFGSDIGEYVVATALIGTMVGMFRKHNCHVHRCWRLSRHAASDSAGVVHLVCRHHHPNLGAEHRLLPHHLVRRG